MLLKAEAYQEDHETNQWYERNPWRLVFIGRGTSPRVTRDSMWVSVEELFDRKRPIEMKAWNAIQKASRFFGKMLRHGENAPWAPQRDEVGAISAELAFNVAVSQGIMLKQQKPWEIYGCFRLEVKDTGRPRFHALAREPSQAERRSQRRRSYPT